ncbi:hypothetical protein TNIN_16721 [Trichonephila inaurata madagascariensis]|uniref:Uncharacterized protein n=1 Tax=Trichonephila inaurata madagascariensis TaxID=2747483 RepID=A0A8X6YPM1_9ARAC|nr:hypothetical protein TNIN_16721 [Trichonephila inaurata madagascariensis]
MLPSDENGCGLSGAVLHIIDTVQLTLFIRLVDENCIVTLKLGIIIGYRGIAMGTSTRSHIFHEFLEGLLVLKVPVTNIYNITTNRTQNMSGKTEFVRIFTTKNSLGIMPHFCIAHQDTL